jgi:hypothetical protein
MWGITYPGLDVGERNRVDNGEAHQEDIGASIGERANTIVI